MRVDIRRRRRRLWEEGEVRLEINAGDRLPEALEEGFRIEGSGWKDARGSAIRSREDTRRFYTEIGHWAAERGWLRLCFLHCGERTIAFHFDLECGRVMYNLKGGYDREFARFSPSKVLHYLMLEHAFATGVGRYDFLGLDEPFKRELATGVDEQRLLYVCGPGFIARAEQFGYISARSLRGRLRETRAPRRASE